MPVHVAIIMDGNGRWAEKRGLDRSAGHRAGVDAVRSIVEVCGQIHIKYLTLYTFSLENWKRPKSEIDFLFKLLNDTARSQLSDLIRNNVRLIATGQIEQLPFVRRKALLHAIARTSKNTGLVLNLALNYSGRMEILEAVKRIAREYKANRIKLSELDEGRFAEYLFTHPLPDPDLLIRTSGEFRLSNFLLWQTSYTELYVTNTFWPDFGQKEFLEIIIEYQKRERRFGKL
ncbi:MAG: isoprenyl transferase [candidate division Zixibacteria bacterium]|nr:isoprenyl transferase [candidate division Zixibacteria bacterium]